jgi:hypothetical protein
MSVNERDQYGTLAGTTALHSINSTRQLFQWFEHFRHQNTADITASVSFAVLVHLLLLLHSLFVTAIWRVCLAIARHSLLRALQLCTAAMQ